jgi:hypothetical protein
LGAGVVERREAEFVEDDQLVAQQPVDDFADAVVSESSVEEFDEFGCAVLADPMASVDRRRPKRQKAGGSCRCRQ